jgi:hypothetical protein
LCCIVAGAGAALSVAACGDGPGAGFIDAGRLPRVFCERLLACGCLEDIDGGGESGGVPPSCDAWELGSIFPSPYGGYDYGDEYYGGDAQEPEIPLSFDKECADRLAGFIAGVPCDEPLPEIPCESYCSLYFGPGLEGQACEATFQCGRGLRCVRGECRDACAFRPSTEGEPCGPGQPCEPGLRCDDFGAEAASFCVALPVAGAPCLGDDCAAGYWCDSSTGEALCAIAAPAGAPCMGHRECTTGYCPAGFCELLPGPGEPCGAQGSCASPAECVPDDEGGGTCIAVAPVCFGLFFLPYASFEEYYYYYY